MTTQIYLFHNIYGDADNLIANKPDNVITVPFGWDSNTEAMRNTLLNFLNVKVSGLPSVVAWRPEHTVESPHPDDPPKTIQAGWDVINLEIVPRYEWNWQYIQSIIDSWNA